MKSLSCLLLSVLVVLLSEVSCENERSLAGSVVSRSDCKSSKSFSKGAETEDTLSCINYTYDSYSKKLALDHINAAFNCCPGKVTCKASISGDTVIIKELESAPMCDCDCLFDLKMSFEGLDKQTYFIKIIEPYAGDQEELFFAVDFRHVPEGSFCVTRKQYPWGMSLF